jgi:pilus assembly protein CpaC
MRALFPKDDIRLSQANGSVVMSGSVSDPKTATQAQSVVEAAGFKTVNMLASPVKGMTQVQLQVRVAEVNRSKASDLGLSYAYQASNGSGTYLNSGQGPSSLDKVVNGAMTGSLSSALNLFVMAGNTMSMIRALQTQGALRELAEPNLIAMDGSQASFLAGGEFPVPVVQGGGGGQTSVSIIFKEYGVRLNFKPTIVDEDHIRLELEPEVSTIDFANGVKFDGFVIPALRTRRAKTSVELRDGQSFALAGLLDNTETKSLSKVPMLGDIPVLGSLFRSKSFQKNESELMFIVTAQVVKPVNPDDLPQMRGIDGLKGNSPLGVEPKGEGIQGQTGYKISGQNVETPQATEPVKAAEPASKTTTQSDTETSGTSGSGVAEVRKVNSALPMARAAKVEPYLEPIKPR